MGFKGKNVLVTGAGGFIGSHLTETLAKIGANVTAFVRYTSTNKAGFIDDIEEKDNINIEYGDILELHTMQKCIKDKDIVFHLGASISVPYSFHHPHEVIKANSIGTLNVLTAALDNQIPRLIVTSSSEVYGTARFVPITEEHPLQAQSPYAASKIAADKYAESFYKTYGLPVTIVRPFNTFGPRQSARAVIPTIVSQILTKDKIKIGSLTPRRDFLYVKNTVGGFLDIAKAGKETYGEVINLATGKDISIGELIDLIKDITGKDIPVITEEKRIRPENAEVNRLCGDASKIKKLIGWKPKISFEQGLRETIEWISKNINNYDPEEYHI